jgi:hypothetical protein
MRGLLAVWPAKEDAGTPRSIDLSGIWRLVFWLTYVLGNLVLAFSFLLAMVPGPRHPDFTPTYIIRSVAAGLMLISILMARWIWKIRYPLSYQGVAIAMRIVIFVAWAEFAFAVYLIIGLATFQLFGHHR